MPEYVDRNGAEVRWANWGARGLRVVLTTVIQAALGALLLLSTAQSQPTAAQQAAARAELQSLVEQAVANGSPGVSAAVATREGVIWTGVAGKADLETGAPVRPDMLFGIGSITKTFVAVVVLQLVEEGRLRLDDTPASILGDVVKEIANADRATVAQLLNHTSGIATWEFDAQWIHEGRGDRLDPARLWGKADTLDYIRGDAPTAPPGVKHDYSNTNFTLLGLMIEKVTGQDAVLEIHRRILEPLGIKDIYLEGFEPLPVQRLAHRYHRADEEFRRSAGMNRAFPVVRDGLIDASRSNLSVEWTAGGMVATAADLARYAVALRDGRLLRPQSMAFMLDWLPVDEHQSVGHNLFRTRWADNDLTLVGHTGGVLGYGASMHWVEGADAVVVVLHNLGTMHAGRATPAAGSKPAGLKQFGAAALKLSQARSCR